MTKVFILPQESCCFRDSLRLFLKIFFNNSFRTGREDALKIENSSRTASTDRGPIPHFFILDKSNRQYSPGVTAMNFIGNQTAIDISPSPKRPLMSSIGQTKRREEITIATKGEFMIRNNSFS